MRTIKLSCFLLCVSLLTFAQKPEYTLTGITKSKITVMSVLDSKPLEVGQIVQFVSFGIDQYSSKACYTVKNGEKKLKISGTDIDKISFDDPKSLDEVWQLVRLNSDFDMNLSSRGLQYKLRQELEDETIALMQYFGENNGFFNDAFLEDYIQGMLYTIHSPTLNDERPGNLTVKIIHQSDPNAFCTPTGTILLTTGLLSTIKSEDELIGILTHEVAHFVLDHQVININKAEQRQKRAEFWAGFATVVAAATEVYVAAKHDVYLEGSLTMSTAILSSSIAILINERIGTNYNHEQELEADTAAVVLLKYMKKDPKALSAALSRIRDYSILIGNYSALSGSGTHPGLGERIARMGACDPNSFDNESYDKIISLVNTQNAIYEYNLSHLETAIGLTNRNISSGVATEDDYLVKAMSIRILNNTPEKTQEALDLIIKAKSLNVTPRNYLYKQEGITLIRLGKKNEAKTALQVYLKNLESIPDKNTYTIEEIEWTKKMIYKLNAI
jgi:hypothetical protein